ncbi:alpha/beta-hydrolase [Yamadazyma tenuis ATCC 10573]|uniref:Alpha/beta-hydrolase n=1 Tax=Candida tenuis (strain ATCC 10573 / BCRC 21748 / CBS 615 / JCM 9827 / NBRC 10315 / NRRL Y-1498 / VKM Y-70) TaxID=590646 RepID=G3B9D4_CANTC|nr:alpha/beta-hydrolase [Yamadazyma tenuis ATCC 10573]EGV62478.1 alpha/beta-hydrolase [Yamadazyma tenuis ATCC 10573]
MSLITAGTLITMKLLKFVKLIMKIGVSLGGLVLAGLYSYQSKLIYPASINDGRGHCATPDEYNMPDYELVELKTKDGETLQGYSLKHDVKSPTYKNKTVLMLSPNAGNIGHALPIVSVFYLNFGYNVFIYSYRGYGKSTGQPSEKGLKVDAQTVVKYLREDKQFSNSSLILYGRSLGGAVTIYIAATMSDAVSGIILENTFLSIPKTVPHIFPFLKYAARFVHQVWDSESLVPKIPVRIPVLLLSARKDEIVPPNHMDRIFELLETDNKSLVKFPDSQHNDTVIQDGYWDKVQMFIKENINPVGY